MPNTKTRRQAPNATYIPLEMGFAFATQREEIYKKKRNVHGQRKKLASPNARDTNMLVFLALGDAKMLSFALGDAKVPDARYFAFWWNIGFKRENVYSRRKFLLSYSSQKYILYNYCRGSCYNLKLSHLKY